MSRLRDSSAETGGGIGLRRNRFLGHMSEQRTATLDFEDWINWVLGDWDIAIVRAWRGA